MSQQQQRPRLRPAPASRRVGEPNVLSNQATPNALSTMGTPGGSGSPATPSSRTASSAVSAGRPVLSPRPMPSGPASPQPADDSPPRGRRLPSVGTLVVIGFLILTAARLANNIGIGRNEPTTQPGPTGAPAVDVGVVTFGRALGDSCDLTQVSDRFALGVDVWWRAELAATQAADADVVVRAYRDDGQIDRYVVPAEPDLGEWDVLCPGDPVPGEQVGAYRLEVWSGDEQQLLATGSFSRT